MYVSTIDQAHLGELTARMAYILILKVTRHYHSAPQHGKSWHLGLIGREAVRVAATLMMLAYHPADHA